MVKINVDTAYVHKNNSLARYHSLCYGKCFCGCVGFVLMYKFSRIVMGAVALFCSSMCVLSTPTEDFQDDLKDITHRSGMSDYLDFCYTHYEILKILEGSKPKEYSEKLNELIKEAPHLQLLHQLQRTASTYNIFKLQLDSGLYAAHINQAKALNNPVSSADLLKGVTFNRKKDHAYANSGYLLVARLIEAISGKSFEAVFREEIALPAGLSASYAPVSGSYKVLSKNGSLSQNKGLLDRGEIFIDMANAVGAGNVISTRNDLIQWGRYFFKSSPQIIRDAILGNYGSDSDGDIINLGLSTDTDYLGGLIGHQGGIDSFSSFFGYAPKSDTLIILLSNDHEDADQLMESLTSRLAEPKKD